MSSTGNNNLSMTPIRFAIIRKLAGLAQHELAERLGVNPMTVSKWERGLLVPGRSVQRWMRGLESVVDRRQGGGW